MCIGADPEFYVRLSQVRNKVCLRNRMGLGTFRTKEPENIQEQRSLGILGNKGPVNTQEQKSLRIFRTKEPKNIQDKGA